MVTWTFRRAVPLALAALLVLGGCDDEEEKNKVVEVEVEEGTEVRVRIKDKEADELVVVGELALFTLVIAWALFGPGATRRRSEHR